jgi:hypothetical protein
MQDVGVDKQRCDQSPQYALFEVAQTENEISLCERRILLPRPKTGGDASEYQQ